MSSVATARVVSLMGNREAKVAAPQPLTLDEKRAILEPLVARLCTSHFWRDYRHVQKPFGAREINEHLVGAHKYGLAPVAPGESTCRIALLDFDSHSGATPFEEMRRVANLVSFDLEQDGYAPVLWRSSGGKGIHLYLMWEEKQEAHCVRAMLTEVLARCGLKNGTKGVAAGEAEVFAKQDSVPVDRFGSMFVLPFAGQSEVLT